MCRPGSTGWPARRLEADISFFTRLLFAAYFLEAGLILVITPWMDFWDQNVFLGAYPALQEALASPFARGAVSGVGAITTIAGIAELTSAIIWRFRAAEASEERSGPAA
jgi:hypothetical protein